MNQPAANDRPERAAPPGGALPDATRLLESMTEGVSLSSEDGTIIYTNPAEDRMFGYAPGELIGRHVSVQNAYPAEENDRIVGEVIARLRDKGAWDGEWRNRRKDGSEFVTASRITAVLLEGKPHWLCVQRDVTEARATAAKLAASEARLRRSQEAGGIGSYEWDLATGEGTQSDGMLRMVGLPPGKSYSLKEIMAPVLREDMGAVMATVAAIGEGTPRRETEYRIRRPADGAIRWIRDTGQVELDDEGQPVRWVGIVQDVTERTEAEQALKRSEARLLLAQRAARAVAWEWDLRDGVIRWSDVETLRALAGEDIGAVTPLEEWVGRIHPDDRGQRLADGIAAAQTGAGRAVYRILRDGAVRWLEAVGQVSERGADGTPHCVTGITLDITERRQAEDHQRLLINELNHRVKNMLAIVQGIAQQSFRGSSDPAAIREALEGRLGALAAAHNLLTGGNWEAAPLRGLIEQAIAALRPGEGRLMLSGPDLLVAPKTAVSLAMAAHELATNALKYGSLGSGGGTVEVTWRIDDGRLRLVWRERGGPPVPPSPRRGFGTRMLQQGLAAELDGEVTLDFRPEGLVCTVDAPLPKLK